MANFSDDDFTTFFREAGRRYNIRNIDSYLNSVFSDRNDYADEAGYKQQVYIPDRYFGREFEYFILYHFARHFLDGLGYRQEIIATLTRYPQITSVNLVSDRDLLYSINLKETEEINFDRYRFQLFSLFLTIGTSLLNESFSVEDFIK